MDPVEAVFGLRFVVLFCGIYFLPFVIAKVRGLPNRDSIFTLNLFLGWTIIGWAVAGALSVASDSEPDKCR
jgi:hypothetical protein